MNNVAGSFAIGLALASGASLAIQYTIMIAVMQRGVGFTSALLLNSLVGLIVLSVIETMRAGPQFILEIAARAKLWFLLPGLLGTFFVFASLYGYKHQGAAATVALIVVAQLATGLIVDSFGLTGASRTIGLHTLFGAIFLMVGAALVLH